MFRIEKKLVALAILSFPQLLILSIPLQRLFSLPGTPFFPIASSYSSIPKDPAQTLLLRETFP
jgi:hypothetical protein